MDTKIKEKLQSVEPVINEIKEDLREVKQHLTEGFEAIEGGFRQTETYFQSLNTKIESYEESLDEGFKKTKARISEIGEGVRHAIDVLNLKGNVEIGKDSLEAETPGN